MLDLQFSNRLLLPYLCVAKFVHSVININGAQKFLTCFLAVNKLTIGDCTGVQYLVTVAKTKKV